MKEGKGFRVCGSVEGTSSGIVWCLGGRHGPGRNTELFTARSKGDCRGTQTLGSCAQGYFLHTLGGVRVLVPCSARYTEAMVLGRGRSISGTRCCRCLGLSVPWQCHTLGFIDAVALVPQRSSKPAGQTSVSGSQSLPRDWGQPWEDQCGSGEHWQYHAVRVDMFTEDRASLCEVQVTNVEGQMISVLCCLWVKG